MTQRAVTSRRGLALWAALTACLLLPAPAQARPGQLDRGFGRGGVAVAPFKPFGEFSSFSYLHPGPMARQRDGKLLVVGNVERDGGERGSGLALARFTARGRLDRRFGRRGRVRLERCNGSSRCASFSVKTILVQPDGRIVLGGDIGDYPYSNLFLVRLLPDGGLDKRFDGDGYVETAIRPTATYGTPSASVDALFLDPDGKLLAAARGDPPAFVRYRRDGVLDESFGDGGIRPLEPRLGVYVWTRLPDGRLVAAGGNPNGTTVARYFPDGSLDPSFASGGVSRLPVGGWSWVTEVAVQRDGRIVLAGTAYPDPWLKLRGLEPDGSLDLGFGSGCRRRGGRLGGSPPLALARDGRILVAGVRVVKSQARGVVRRYSPRGCLDRRFRITALSGLRPDDLLLDPRGRAVVGGPSWPPHALAVARFLAR